MAKYVVADSDLTSVADAIRTKGGTSADLSFPSGFVTAIGNISGGTQPTLITKTIGSNGTYNASSDSADGYSSVTVAVPTSAGTQYVTGTFTGDTEGTALAVTIPYAGSGYLVSGTIYPTTGTFKSGGSITSSTQRYAVVAFSFIKNDVSSAPTYTDNTEPNLAESTVEYKNSDSDAAVVGYSGKHQNRLFNSSANASAYSDAVVRIKSSTSMSVYIASTSYGFLKDVEYTYQFVYSS